LGFQKKIKMLHESLGHEIEYVSDMFNKTFRERELKTGT
jgi:hypothetical protein